ncbi:TetR/AcrR family transcriptional regulator [Elusimicrobiota bacterium]
MTDRSVIMDKKEKILKIASEIFAKKGFHDTTMDEIATESDVAKGTLYNYFKDKEDLYTEVLIFLTRGLENIVDEAADSDKDLWEKIEYIINKNLEFFSREKHFLNIVTSDAPHKIITKEENLDKIKDVRSSRISKVIEIFRMHRSEGIIRDDFSDEQAALLCMNLKKGLLVMALEGWDERHKMNTKTVVEFLKNGLQKK